MKKDLGDTIDIYCSSCRLNLHGSVTAFDGDTIVQVTCRTCGNVQKFKPSIPEDVLRQRKIKRAFAMRDRKNRMASVDESPAASSGTDITSRWRSMTDGVNSMRAAFFSERKTYKEGDTMIHSKHGLGVVTQVLHENAILVLFREVELPLEMSKQGD